jgi:hypothetical protein
MNRSRALRAAAWYGVPMIACVLVYWYALRAWFTMDDFAWLGLRLSVHSPGDLMRALFEPQAQGTVRVLSERLYFLVLSSIFGMHAMPYRAIALATQFANLALLSIITRRVIGSTLAAFIAPILYIFNNALSVPMAWASCYNQILWTLLVLTAFYCFLRYIETGENRWRVAQWIAYLLGFGVLELNVVYPALAALYALCCARAYLRKTIPLFVPAVLFATLHAFIPKPQEPTYAMYFDLGLVTRLRRYFAWAVGPSRLGDMVSVALARPGKIASLVIAIALLAFAASRLRRRDWRPAFLLGWFFIALAPLLPLANHTMDYYLTVPAIGVCILGAWAIAESWRQAIAVRVIAVALALVYCVGGYIEIRSATRWRYESSRRLHAVLEQVNAAWHRNPRGVILLSNVDWDLFAAGFIDDPFRLYGLPRPFLTPGSEAPLKEPDPPRGLNAFTTTVADVMPALNQNNALVLAVSDQRLTDVTAAYSAVARTQYTPVELSRIDVGQPGAALKLGPTWYPVESGFRWMPDAATLRMVGPHSPSERLHVSGYTPADIVAKGPVRLTVSVDSREIGAVTITKPDAPFEFDFPLPAQSTGKSAVEVGLHVDHTTALPGDPRKLGLIFGVFEIK